MGYLTANGEYTIQSSEEGFAQAFVREVKEDLRDITRSFFKIGFRLSEAVKLHYYEELGYDNIIELSEDIFGIKKSMTYGLMQVYNYCRNRDRKTDCAMEMDKRYEPYNFSQLQEISRLKWAGGEHLIKPTDNRDKIKAFVSAWNKDGENAYAGGCETIDDYLRKTGRLIEVEPTALPAPNLLEQNVEAEDEGEPQEEIFQPVGKIEEEPLAHEPEEPALEIVESEPVEDSEEFKDEDYPQSSKKQTGEFMSDEELSNYCLRQGPSYGLLKPEYWAIGKFKINDKLLNGATSTEFLDYVKELYGNCAYSGEDTFYKSMETSPKGLEIERKTGNKLILSWSVVAGRIRRLIENNRYLTVSERLRFPIWKAEQEGLKVDVVDATPKAEPEPQLHAPSIEPPAVAPVTETKQSKALRDYLFNLPTEEVVNQLLMKIIKIYPLKGESATFLSTVRKRLVDWLNTSDTLVVKQ